MELAELQARLIYALIVAGKSATFADKKTRELLKYAKKKELPFEMLARLAEGNLLGHALTTAKTGNYYKLNAAFRDIARMRCQLDLDACGPEELERISGVGPKTSRFFIMWTRGKGNYAALDTHVLRWLRAQGYLAPWATPTTFKSYAKWEKVFLGEAAKRNMEPAKLDAQIWEEGSRQAMSGKVS